MQIYEKAEYLRIFLPKVKRGSTDYFFKCADTNNTSQVSQMMRKTCPITRTKSTRE
jgi:hypothetical protein